ncbi:MAG TPA: aspartyl/asparaginyl beta-hydroxylase domain-containing protein [Polyangiaceae bacterium]|nr:aspartyl/asparaginyl beta-hydroxylase domain-containing protein [Polyangiaceae bacterium]
MSLTKQPGVLLASADRAVTGSVHGLTRGLCSLLRVETALRLPMRFDADRLKQDLHQIGAELWADHRHGYHDGSWSAVSLIGNSDDPRDIHVSEGRPFVHTSLMQRTPYFKEVVASFRGSKRRARLMRIAAGGRIFPHHDAGLDVDHGVARLHVPVVSDPGNVFWLAGRRVPFRVGETWYGDFSFPHEACNQSLAERVHLVFDVQLDAELIAMLPAGYLQARRRRGLARAIGCHASDAVGGARALVSRLWGT